MTPSTSHDDSREFQCVHCSRSIIIPCDLPPTEGPCPHCGGVVTSPAPEAIDQPLRRSQTTQSSLPAKKNRDTDQNPSQEPSLTFLSPSKTRDQNKPRILSNPLPNPTPLDQGTKKLKRLERQEAETTAAKPGLRKINPLTEQAKPETQERQQKTSQSLKRGDASKPIVASQISGGDMLTSKSMAIDTPFDDLPSTKTPWVKFTLLILILVGALVGGVFTYQYFIESQNLESNQTFNEQHHQLTDEFVQGGWIEPAKSVLRDFINASTAEGKAIHTLQGTAAVSMMNDFYQTDLINDLDTPSDEFQPSHLSDEDHRRGLFRMTYQSETPNGTRPTKVHAYFKHTRDGLKLDWPTFIQTKFQTLHDFSTDLSQQDPRTFRVFISLLPISESNTSERRIFRISDPAYSNDFIYAGTSIESDAAMKLIPVLSELKNNRPITRTATVTLRHTTFDGKPVINIDDLVCWEFLGLGSDAPTHDHE